MNREIKIRKYEPADIPSMVQIWNEVVEEGVAFPQEDFLTDESGADFFAAQTYCGVAEEISTSQVLGLYILHPNNIGRCGHLYERIGFHLLGTVPGGFRLKSGEYDDICLYYIEV